MLVDGKKVKPGEKTRDKGGKTCNGSFMADKQKLDRAGADKLAAVVTELNAARIAVAILRTGAGPRLTTAQEGLLVDAARKIGAGKAGVVAFMESAGWTVEEEPGKMVLVEPGSVHGGVGEGSSPGRKRKTLAELIDEAAEEDEEAAAWSRDVGAANRAHIEKAQAATRGGSPE